MRIVNKSIVLVLTSNWRRFKQWVHVLKDLRILSTYHGCAETETHRFIYMDGAEKMKGYDRGTTQYVWVDREDIDDSRAAEFEEALKRRPMREFTEESVLS